VHIQVGIGQPSQTITLTEEGDANPPAFEKYLVMSMSRSTRDATRFSVQQFFQTTALNACDWQLFSLLSYLKSMVVYHTTYHLWQISYSSSVCLFDTSLRPAGDYNDVLTFLLKDVRNSRGKYVISIAF
jgi:hypothetical protein